MVFDIGGVLSAPEGAVPQVAATLGLPVDVVGPAYWHPRDAYDRGGGLQDYWRAVGAALGLDLAGPGAAELDELDARRWGALRPAVEPLLDEVVTAARTRGLRLALLSNAPASLAAVVRASRWASAFDVAVFSCDLRAAKPEAAVYTAVEDGLRLPGEQLFLLDDRPVNVDAAAARGWRAHHWTGVADGRRALVEAGVLDG